MASKNSVKTYVENSYYHIYNRGVEKRKIFKDNSDYSIFLSYLKTYLTYKNDKKLREQLQHPNLPHYEKDKILKQLRLNNFHNEINLLSYCLMPNHFHLLIKQKTATSIDKFMNSLITRYVMYFNRKYKRVGPLFQDVYKAVLVESEPQLLYLTCYIHRNPASQGDPLQTTQPSSYSEYLGRRKTDWINFEEILSYFSKTNPLLSYQAFVEQTSDFSPIDNLTLENN